MLGVRKVGDAKVRDLDRLPVGRPEEIGRFDVSVNDPLVVNYKSDQWAYQMRGETFRLRYSSPRATSLKIRRVWSTRSVGLLYSSFQRISPPPRYSMTNWG